MGLGRRAAILASVLVVAACASVPRSAGPELRVLSFNIRYGTADDGPDAWPNRREQVFSLIRRQRADVIGMQEVLDFQRREILQALPELEAFGIGREAGDRGEQACILYRRDRFRRVDGGTFWLSDNPETAGSKSWDSSLPRICTWVRLATQDGNHVFDVFNTHFDHRGSVARLEGARLIRERISRRSSRLPVILTADLNAGESSPPVQVLLRVDGGPRLVDSFRVVHPDAGDVGTFHGFKGGAGSGEKIDYVFVSSDFEVLGAAILHDSRQGRYPSDHYPVAARLRFRNARRGP